MLIWSIHSLNGMRSFGVNPITKPCKLRPKADNIIQHGTGCYIIVLEPPSNARLCGIKTMHDMALTRTSRI